MGSAKDRRASPREKSRTANSNRILNLLESANLRSAVAAKAAYLSSRLVYRSGLGSPDIRFGWLRRTPRECMPGKNCSRPRGSFRTHQGTSSGIREPCRRVVPYRRPGKVNGAKEFQDLEGADRSGSGGVVHMRRSKSLSAKYRVVGDRLGDITVAEIARLTALLVIFRLHR